jgi:hypothetical protein
MTVHVYDQVQAALETHLLGCDAVPIEPATGRRLVAFENDRFQPEDERPWWRVNFQTNPTNRRTLGVNGYSRADGNLLVEMYYPAGSGSGEARRAADQLVHHFKSGTQIISDEGVAITVWNSWRAGGFSEPRWYHLNVNVWWSTHRQEL